MIALQNPSPYRILLNFLHLKAILIHPIISLRSLGYIVYLEAF
jgi:hypothetical protein